MTDQGSLDCIKEAIDPTPEDNRQALIAELVSRLDLLSDSLEATNRGLEPRFVQVGEELQSVFSKTSDLERGTVEAVSLMGRESDTSPMKYADEIAHRSLEKLQQSQSEVMEKLGKVEAIARHLGQLHPQSQTLTRIARQLRVIGVYFAVEGSRSSELTTTFSSFTQELRRLADKVGEIAGDISSDSRRAEARQSTAHFRISDDSKRLKKLIDQAEHSVIDAVSEIERIIGFSVSALELIAEHSHRISQYVGSVVVGLQFNDITRQQVEHVVAALQDAQQICLKLPEAADDESDAALGSVYAILSVQAAQMSKVVSSIHEAHASIESAFSQIGSESAQVASSVAGLSSGERAIDSSGDPFWSLKTELGSLQELIGRGQGMSERTTETAVHASEAASLLTQHVKQVGEINYELKIKALNAIVKSVGLGDDGRALSVLAQEVMDLSGECNTFVSTIVNTLESITELSSGMELRMDEPGETDLAEQINAGIRKISEGYRGFIDSSQSATSGVRSLQDEVVEAREGLDFLDELAFQLSQYTQGIEEMMALLSPWSGFAAAQAHGIIEQQAARYTMESEREVQMQALTPTSCAEIFFDEAASPSESGDEDLGDNVELF